VRQAGIPDAGRASRPDIEAEIKEEPMLAQFDRRLSIAGADHIIKNANGRHRGRSAGGIGQRVVLMSSPARDNEDIVIDVVDTESACRGEPGASAGNPM